MNTLILSLLLLLSSSTSLAVDTAASPTASSAGVIERTTHQQLITTIPPSSPSPLIPFLTSPSGKYTAFFLRVPTAPAGGGFGNDFCYIQIQETETKTPLWESECTPISTANACSLVFNDDGLAVFDGSQAQWDTGAESADNNPLESLELVDEGDMRIRDKIGELAWRASEDARVNQRCGEVGSPGLGPALPPFAQPIGGSQSGTVFGQQQGSAVSQTFGFGDDESGAGCRSETVWGRLLLVVACWFGWGLV